MNFSKDDISHTSNTLKKKHQNLSVQETLDLTFEILEGLDCYKEKVIPPANSISRDLMTPNSIRFPERD